MRNTSKVYAMLLSAAVGTGVTALGVSVTPSTDADALANSILGPGITLTPGSASLISGPDSAGTFTGGVASGIGIASGILLTSGSVNNAPGPNNSDNATGIASGSGDADLDALVGGGTTDSTSLQFNFTTAGGDLYFNYVFGSEEYNEYTLSDFNDVFAFFLDGVNIALIPGTSDPVSINTVNGGNPLGSGAQHPELFNNNDIDDGGPFFDLQYDGFTHVLTASALGLGAGEHTIKLTISDRSDTAYDSGVFLQGGSFSDTPPPPPGGVPDAGSTLPLIGLGLAGLAAIRRKLLA